MTMKKSVLLLAFLPVLLGGVASAKLPPFSFEATPTHPRVGEPITLTMRCFEDVAHTEPWPSCFGQGGRMAWVHPLDLEGTLTHSDWIAVEGHASASGATVGTIVLSEPGAYVVKPLWRGWGGTIDDRLKWDVGFRARSGSRSSSLPFRSEPGQSQLALPPRSLQDSPPRYCSVAVSIPPERREWTYQVSAVRASCSRSRIPGHPAPCWVPSTK